MKGLGGVRNGAASAVVATFSLPTRPPICTLRGVTRRSQWPGSVPT